MACMCLIWFNMHLFYWILVLMMSLYIRVVITCTLFYFNVSFWPEMAFKFFLTDVGSFLPILKIHPLVLFLAINPLFHWLLFSDWEMYDMFWCSNYFVTMTKVVHIGVKLTLASNISYLIKGWFEKMEGWKYLGQA